MSEDFLLLPEDIAEIVALLDGSGYERLDVRTARFSLRLARAGTSWSQVWEHLAADEPLEGGGVPPVTAPDGSDRAAEAEGIVAVRPPLPGTFYHAPKPGAPPFIAIGDAVNPDMVVGIIETMKVMNSVAAGVAGEVVEIVAADGAMVDAEDVLIRIRAGG
ncbi:MULTISPECIES: acetyl-CoA carboxylase biotin carboxyl carrier protein [unclassified Sphingomonas]|uniref:acetyl-CoA carboxylase biotin carboxyl carrier protein n=1 Tax=unclassified Sphingomonas TaxID=196159 RepID=UPI0006FEC88F|nr:MULTISPECIES: biotin/lipoyl-containing protein [unclassified Sphingomonas]KRB78784.1 hypothetical protein ASE00_21380 [Sphingomonas sp. Root710]KRB93694.1 hypothetical protein ASE22_25150 [Sphingomonas sp. Root720]